MLILILLSGFVIGWQIFRRNRRFFQEHSGLCLVWTILMGIIFLSYLQHFLIHNDFYSGRFALFIYPLFMLNLLYMLDYLFKNRIKAFSMVIAYGMALLLTLNFSLNMNLRFYKDWKYDSGTKDVMTILAEDRQKQQAEGKTISLGINWIFEPTTNFYRYTRDLSWLRKTHRKGARATDDYYYIFRSDTNAVMANGKPVLFSAEETDAFLVRNQPK